jgi:hypothetical protein
MLSSSAISCVSMNTVSSNQEVPLLEFFLLIWDTRNDLARCSCAQCSKNHDPLRAFCEIYARQYSQKCANFRNFNEFCCRSFIFWFKPRSHPYHPYPFILHLTDLSLPTASLFCVMSSSTGIQNLATFGMFSAPCDHSIQLSLVLVSLQSLFFNAFHPTSPFNMYNVIDITNA